jgi:hypothetical protein
MLGSHYLWIDNFSKFLRKTTPTVAKDVYATCNWTGVAAFENTDPNVNDHVVRRQDGVVPAMPNNILQCNSSVRAAIKQLMTEDRNYYDRSVVKRFDVRNVPPKINTKIHVNLRDRIESRTNSMDCVHPVKLIDINIGSNAGLCTIMRQLYDSYDMDNPEGCTRYLNLNVDENIYWRILKVLIFTLVHTALQTCNSQNPVVPTPRSRFFLS